MSDTALKDLNTLLGSERKNEGSIKQSNTMLQIELGENLSVMSGNTLKDLNKVLGSERKNEVCVKQSSTLLKIENAIENIKDLQGKNSIPLSSTYTNGHKIENGGVEVRNPEVEYIESVNLNKVEDLDLSLKSFGLISDKAQQDLNSTLWSKRTGDRFIKQSNTVLESENADENIKDCQGKPSISSVSADVNGHKTVNAEVEVGNAEVEYIESVNLNDVEDLDLSIKRLIPGLESKDWVLVCESLNIVRKLAMFHKDSMCDILGSVTLLVVKSLKSPRSAVCKTAIMTSADLFESYSDCMIDFIDPMLVQLFLKSSQDKRFVCDAAERTLVGLTTWISPAVLLPKLEACLQNKNPRVRAGASMCFCRSVAKLGGEGIRRYGVERLLEMGACGVRDKLPESREGARRVLLEVQLVYGNDDEHDSWQRLCESNLSPLSAQAVLRVTTVAAAAGTKNKFLVE